MRRATGVRPNGPYKHGRKWRVQFITGSGSDRSATYKSFATRAAAEAAIDACIDDQQGTTVSAAVDQFIVEKRAAGLAESTLDSYRDRLDAILGPVMRRPVRRAQNRGEELYLAVLDGHSADTHQHMLQVAKLWGKWCVKRHLLSANPFADVEPLGRKVFGADKPRLTVDESRKLELWCLTHPGDQGAVLTLGYLYLGSRNSELIKRDVRDLDDDGNLLWIRETKTVAGRRRLRIPAELAAMLMALTRGRDADAPLFSHSDGSRWSRHHARKEVIRVCVAAGVPEMPPQALRRTQSTLATEAGETSLAVARHLGHSTGEAPAVTERSYVSREAAADARRDRAMRALRERN
jgi:integrase